MHDSWQSWRRIDTCFLALCRKPKTSAHARKSVRQHETRHHTSSHYRKGPKFKSPQATTNRKASFAPITRQQNIQIPTPASAPNQASHVLSCLKMETILQLHPQYASQQAATDPIVRHLERQQFLRLLVPQHPKSPHRNEWKQPNPFPNQHPPGKQQNVDHPMDNRQQLMHLPMPQRLGNQMVHRLITIPSPHAASKTVHLAIMALAPRQTTTFQAFCHARMSTLQQAATNSKSSQVQHRQTYRMPNICHHQATTCASQPNEALSMDNNRTPSRAPT